MGCNAALPTRYQEKGQNATLRLSSPIFCTLRCSNPVRYAIIVPCLMRRTGNSPDSQSRRYLVGSQVEREVEGGHPWILVRWESGAQCSGGPSSAATGPLGRTHLQQATAPIQRSSRKASNVLTYLSHCTSSSHGDWNRWYLSPSVRLLERYFTLNFP